MFKYIKKIINTINSDDRKIQRLIAKQKFTELTLMYANKRSSVLVKYIIPMLKSKNKKEIIFGLHSARLLKTFEITERLELVTELCAKDDGAIKLVAILTLVVLDEPNSVIYEALLELFTPERFEEALSYESGELDNLTDYLESVNDPRYTETLKNA